MRKSSEEQIITLLKEILRRLSEVQYPPKPGYVPPFPYDPYYPPWKDHEVWC